MLAINKLERRVLDISYKKKLSHLSSCLGAVGLLDKLYKIKGKDEPVVLSNGHAALALYVVLEKYEGKDAEDLYDRHGTHPNRNLDDGIHVSTGSLGQGLPIAVGMALADRERIVYCMVSDGELAEGSCWEAMRIASELRLDNLRIEVCANGYSAYSKVDLDWLDIRLNCFFPTLLMRVNVFDYPSWLQGVAGHYVVMDEEKYKEVTE